MKLHQILFEAWSQRRRKEESQVQEWHKETEGQKPESSFALKCRGNQRKRQNIETRRTSEFQNLEFL